MHVWLAAFYLPPRAPLPRSRPKGTLAHLGPRHRSCGGLCCTGIRTCRVIGRALRAERKSPPPPSEARKGKRKKKSKACARIWVTPAGSVRLISPHRHTQLGGQNEDKKATPCLTRCGAESRSMALSTRWPASQPASKRPSCYASRLLTQQQTGHGGKAGKGRSGVRGTKHHGRGAVMTA